MTRAIPYVVVTLFTLLISIIISQSIDIRALKKSLTDCGTKRVTAEVNKTLAQSSIEYQNKRVRDAEKLSEQMRIAGEAAMVEAERTIDEYEQRIEDLRRAPKANSCEGVRVKLVTNLGLHL